NSQTQSSSTAGCMRSTNHRTYSNRKRNTWQEIRTEPGLLELLFLSWLKSDKRKLPSTLVTTPIRRCRARGWFPKRYCGDSFHPTVLHNYLHRSLMDFLVSNRWYDAR